jgi:hypothetical protein
MRLVAIGGVIAQPTQSDRVSATQRESAFVSDSRPMKNDRFIVANITTQPPVIWFPIGNNRAMGVR